MSNIGIQTLLKNDPKLSNMPKEANALHNGAGAASSNLFMQELMMMEAENKAGTNVDPSKMNTQGQTLKDLLVGTSPKQALATDGEVVNLDGFVKADNIQQTAPQDKAKLAEIQAKLKVLSENNTQRTKVEAVNKLSGLTPEQAEMIKNGEMTAEQVQDLKIGVNETEGKIQPHQLLGKKNINKAYGEKNNQLNSQLVEKTDEQVLEGRKSLFMNKDTLAQRAEENKALLTQKAAMNQYSKTIGTEGIIGGPEAASRAFIPERKSIFGTKAPEANITNTAELKIGADPKVLNNMTAPTPGLLGEQDSNILGLRKQMQNQNSINQFQMMDAGDSNIIKFNPSKLSSLQDVDPTSLESLKGESSQVGQVSSGGQRPLQTLQPQVTTMNAVTLDSSLMTESSDQLIERISNYITQKNFEGQKSLELNVKHKELGNFQVRVSEGNTNQTVQLQITTMAKEGMDFFRSHQSRLLISLGSQGIQVQDFKLDSSQNSSDFSRNFSQNGQNQNSSDQSNKDSQRRKQLWDQMAERSA